MTPYYERNGITIHWGDCLEVMRRYIPDNSINLTITSPPYNCGKDYNSVSDNMTMPAYWEFANQWVSEVYRVLGIGGRLAVNLPWWIGKKPRVDAIFEFKKIALQAGLLFLDKIIWIKGNEDNVHISGGWGGGGCGWGTWLSPSGPAIRCATEPILVFCKERRGRGITSGEGYGKCEPGDITKEEFLKWTLDTWFIKGESRRDHPAIFPLEVPYRLAKLYTWEQDIILDLFMGSGTTGVIANKLNRKFIGIEISEEYCKIAVDRLRQPSFFSLLTNGKVTVEAKQLELPPVKERQSEGNG